MDSQFPSASLGETSAEGSKLDPNQVVPLYHQIYLILRERIIEGHYDTKPLPGELVLAVQGSSALKAEQMQDTLTDAVIVGIVDSLQAAGKSLELPEE